MALPSFKVPAPTWFIVDEFNSTLSNSLLQKLEGECVQDFSAGFLVLFGWASICYDWFVSQSKLMLVHLNDPRRFCTESLFLEWEILFLPVKQEHKTSCTFWVLHCALKKCSSIYKGLYVTWLEYNICSCRWNSSGA